jgi:hypothetical protein
VIEDGRQARSPRAMTEGCVVAKKRGPLKNRLERLVTTPGRPGVKVAALRPEDPHRSIGEVCWDLLKPLCPLAVESAAELTDRLERWPAFTSAEATGWVVGALADQLVHGWEPADALMDDPRLRAVEDEVIAALGPDAHWHANGSHPLRRFRRAGDGWAFDPVTRASFDQVVAARGNGLDLVIVRTAED